MSDRAKIFVVVLACLASGFGVPSALSAGSIDGRVIDSSFSQPIEGVVVSLDGSGATGITDSQGRYVIEDLPADEYLVLISPPPAGYVGQIYGGGFCFNRSRYAACPVDQGFAVSVPAEGSVTGIDFSLDPEVVIEGSITAESTGEPLQGIVTLFWEPDPVLGYVSAGNTGSAANGTYSIRGLPALTFYAVARAPTYLFELFDDLPFDPNDDDPTLGTAIEAVAGTTITGIDFDLIAQSRISGRVTAEDTALPIVSAGVWLYDEAGNYLTGVSTDGLGDYSFGVVPAGTYYVRTFVVREWADEVYDDLLCPQSDGVCDVTRGTPVTVLAGETADSIDFALPVGGRISGTVRNSAGHPVLAQLTAYDALGNPVRFASSEPDGGYTLSGLAPGSYFVTTRLASGYLPQLYQGMPCGDLPEPDCDVTQGTPIAVVLGEEVAGIDFDLERAGSCLPSSTRLCLNQGRFAVEMRWTTQTGESGDGKAVDLMTDGDSGYFYFFRPQNAEVLVKLLDGCTTSFNSYWFFAAGLTNVEVRITVTDTATNVVKTYENPLRRPFRPIQDTSAFATCP